MSRKGKTIIIISVIALAMVALGTTLVTIGCPPYCNLREPRTVRLKPPVEPPQGPVINFPDPALEDAIREALELPYREIHRSDLERFIKFMWPPDDCPPITNLAGLEHAVNLRILDLGAHMISDISPLAELTKLEWLELEWNRITDISPLAGLKNLTSVRLTGNRIESISPLANLINLTCLDLSVNLIEDITPLANLVNLIRLKLSDNLIEDISPLANLTNLGWLWLERNQIRDTSPLSDLINLEALVLDGNKIRDVAPLAGLINLYILSLEANEIEDISALVQEGVLPRLGEIWLVDNPLGADSIKIYIPQLERRGLRVVMER